MNLDSNPTPGHELAKSPDFDGARKPIGASGAANADPSTIDLSKMPNALHRELNREMSRGHAELGHLHVEGRIVRQSAMMAVAHFLAATALGDPTVFQTARELATELTSHQANLARALAYLFVNSTP